jgi:FlgN protein
MTAGDWQALARHVREHLDEQIASARRLLELTVRQGEAIRARDVDAVTRRLHDIKVEGGRRERLELDRTLLLERAGALLGKPAAQVRLEDIASGLAPAEAGQARARSEELRRVLGEVQRETQVNRALMRQELSFLDHLLRLAGHPAEPGYRRSGEQPLTGTPVSPVPVPRRMLDLQA